MDENQQDKALLGLRAEIDKIDEQIISSLKKRMEVVAQVAKLKEKNHEKFYIKSAREADMIKDMIKKTGDDFPKNLIIDLWRKIITAANMREQPISVALHNPKNLAQYEYLVRSYYFDGIALDNFDSANSVVVELEKNRAQIGVFALPKISDEADKKEDMAENWWMTLANNRDGLRVFAKIPLLENADKNAPQLVAVAIKEPEKSQEDSTLLYVESAKEIGATQILSALKGEGIAAEILKSVKLQQFDGIAFHLLELDGFYLEKDFVNFSKNKIKPFIKVLGHFAKAIKL